MSTWNETPKSERVHIGFFGKRNSGKSSLLNALADQEVSIVSEVAGTTADPVYKAMELHGIGPCVLIDTAGFDDDQEILGEARIAKTKRVLEQTDIGVFLFSGVPGEEELGWLDWLKEKKKPVLCVVSRSDTYQQEGELRELVKKVQETTGFEPVTVSVREPESLRNFRERLIRVFPEDYGAQSILKSLVSKGDLVLAVMPQDIQAPKGRLILPQVQTLRELLDRECMVMSVTARQYESALAALKKPPKLIVTDSQVFAQVYEKKPEESLLTSFSILFAGYKGDLAYYLEGVRAVESLTESSKVLIAECCTHAPLSEDIGRVKLPRLLKQRVGGGLTVEIKSGVDFPKKPEEYDLIIQCGGCMFNRAYVMSRIERAKKSGVPMTNYGVVLAYLNGILEFVARPE